MWVFFFGWGEVGAEDDIPGRRVFDPSCLKTGGGGGGEGGGLKIWNFKAYYLCMTAYSYNDV